MFEIYTPYQMNKKIQKKQFYNSYIEFHDIEPIIETLRKVGSGLLLCQDEEIGFICPYVMDFSYRKTYLFGNSKTFITVFKNDFILELFNELSSMVGSLRIIEDTHDMFTRLSDNKTTIQMGNINTITLIDDTDSITILDLCDIIESILENIPKDMKIFNENERFFSEEFGFILTTVNNPQSDWEKITSNGIVLNYDFEFLDL